MSRRNKDIQRNASSPLGFPGLFRDLDVCLPNQGASCRVNPAEDLAERFTLPWNKTERFAVPDVRGVPQKALEKPLSKASPMFIDAHIYCTITASSSSSAARMLMMCSAGVVCSATTLVR